MDKEAKPKAATTSKITARGSTLRTVGWRIMSRTMPIGSVKAVLAALRVMSLLRTGARPVSLLRAGAGVSLPPAAGGVPGAVSAVFIVAVAMGFS